MQKTFRIELVTDRETRQKWTHRIESVCGDDPLQFGLINVEVLADGRQRDEDGSGVRGLRPTPSVKVAMRRHVDVIESVRRVGREESSEYVCVSRACEWPIKMSEGQLTFEMIASVTDEVLEHRPRWMRLHTADLLFREGELMFWRGLGLRAFGRS